MSYLQEDKIYIYVCPDNEEPSFPVPAASLNITTSPVIEGFKQVVAIPKNITEDSQKATIRSLQTAKSNKDHNFVIITQEFEDKNLLILTKNSAVWLTQVVPLVDTEIIIEKLKNYVTQYYNQSVSKVIEEKGFGEGEKDSQKNGLTEDGENKLRFNKTYLYYVLLGSAILAPIWIFFKLNS